MFAIIDIETCGGKFVYQKSRIIEICILVHDGLTLVNRFSTLLNPECYIAPMYTNISGITNEMVENAPKFYEVAKQIDAITKDCVFVAHNAKFDYSFVRDEFASLGFSYKRETLCTVQLSRKLIPGKLSYSLGKLCAQLGIQVDNRHRAEGDAQATVKLFELLLREKATNPFYKNKGVTELNKRKVDGIKKYILDKLPEECGVYYYLDKDQNIIYIGKSINMYSRATNHFANDTKKAKKMLFELMNVDFVKTGSELIALLHESNEIKVHKPTYNSVRKSEIFTHSIFWNKDSNGIINFKISEFNTSDNVLVSFTKYVTARETLERWIDEHALCLQYTALTGEGSICFNHQIKKCNGICAGEESADVYNKRAAEILEQYIFRAPNFIIIDKGRTINEESFIMIENRKYLGYGYYDKHDQYSEPAQLRELLQTKNHYPDCDDLIRSWMKVNVDKCKVIKY
jgi:DNA polymerase-3 subunit epsilon